MRIDLLSCGTKGIPERDMEIFMSAVGCRFARHHDLASGQGESNPDMPNPSLAIVTMGRFEGDRAADRAPARVPAQDPLQPEEPRVDLDPESVGGSEVAKDQHRRSDGLRKGQSGHENRGCEFGARVLPVSCPCPT